MDRRFTAQRDVIAQLAEQPDNFAATETNRSSTRETGGD
jgi:hypothetical protein